jgi:hypothetical protein
MAAPPEAGALPEEFKGDHQVLSLNPQPVGHLYCAAFHY